MKTWPLLVIWLAALALVACAPSGDDLWFRGGLDAAIEEAAERETLVFVEFYTPWCSWCRRLEAETLTDADVRRELDGLVAVRLDAEGNGREAADRFGIESYPTMVFLDGAGEEVERIVGYLPPERFLAELRRIRTGDTLFACLEQLRDNPADREAVKRAVKGLLERSDPEGAIAKIELYHGVPGHDHELCKQLMFEAGRDLHYRLYLTAAKLYRKGWERPMDVPPVPGAERLRQLFEEGLVELDPEEQAERLRKARFADTEALLDLVTADEMPKGDLYGVAELALRGGHYDLAGELYAIWFAEASEGAGADDLNRAAWQLYLARESVDTAVEMARTAYEADPSADVADTLARLLYVDGQRVDAIALARSAAAEAHGDRALEYLDVVELMEQGRDLGDRPAFEDYPGPPGPGHPRD
ncbi:MAG TPA: thioredoxin fold domain-containing protein [Methylomirabilota bacterium]|nr:thioredoxin fold domain-containing protein [Methylomirabilota bacterium]